MKVLRNTPDQLIISHKPIGLALMAYGFILAFVVAGMRMLSAGEGAGALILVLGLGCGGLAFVAFVVRTQVIFDRPNNSLTLRRRSVLGYRAITHALSDLGRAKLEQSTSANSKTLYRPVLELTQGMSAGLHPIIGHYSNSRQVPRMVDTINDWLDQSPGPTSP